KIAFIGLDDDGVADIWTLELKTSKWERITHDLHAERDLDWGEPGIAFNSDATPNGSYDLFLVKPEAGAEPVRIRPSDAQHGHPRFVPGTSQLLYSSDETKKWDVYEINVATPDDTPPPSTPETADVIRTAGAD